MSTLEDTFKEIDFIETARGSIYKYLQDGHTQRFKKVENKLSDPQDALVFIPDYNWVQQNAPKQFRDMFGKNEVEYTQILLDYVHEKGKRCYIVDEKGDKIESNEEISNIEGQIYIAFLSGEKVDFHIPVSKTPKLGFSTYDTRRYKEGEQNFRERHIGHEVVRIVFKDGRVVS